MTDILTEARLVVGERREAYDDCRRNFERIARMWSVVLGMDVTAEQVALCMIAMKVARETFKHSRDNIVDIAGYADCLGRLHEDTEGVCEVEEGLPDGDCGGDGADRGDDGTDGLGHGGEGDLAGYLWNLVGETDAARAL